MWIFTTDGFYSVVHDRYCSPGEVVIRARVRRDLEAIRHFFDDPEILEFHQADYRFRMIVDKGCFEDYLLEKAIGLDYNNFKNEVATVDGDPARLRALHEVWAAMHRLQERAPVRRPETADEICPNCGGTLLPGQEEELPFGWHDR